ncbi:hypothetical protein LXL04_010341 [Taraxacum kok-saghyz]
MARVRNWYNQSKSVALIWFIYFITFYAVFRMASKVYPRSTDRTPNLASVNKVTSGSNKFVADLQDSNAERHRMYETMSNDLDEHGTLFLKHGETSQSLSLSDLFDYKNGSVTPVLKSGNPSVRANVLYMIPKYSLPISKVVRDIFSPTFGKGKGRCVNSPLEKLELLF